MNSEIPFRITLLLIILLTSVFGIYYRRRAASSGERISHEKEGYAFFLILRLSGAFLWFFTLAYLLAPESVKWARFEVPDAVRWSGAVVAVISSLGMYWTLSSLGTNLTDTVVTRAAASLVTIGPYRWVRHPFYVTAAWLMGSVTLLSANLLIGIASVTVLALIFIRTTKEEQMLVERFGQRYLDYMKTTGRFFPRLRA